MRSIIRFMVAGAAALPLVIGASGIASADEVSYDSGTASADSNGAFIHNVVAGASEEYSYLAEDALYAGEDGAGYWGQLSWTYESDNAGHHEVWHFSGDDGAVTGYTNSTATEGHESESSHDDD
ncbi:hypothetical protein [Saccharothrix xinjiangensis]|uniref:Uncharacterized protein n=1 Tax=Saccharothrix xinjiangensis TaxID=204798 RepID=A0ABV9XWS5_9PSEU